ncbi:MAG: tRNA preQ1(34) S-adenosylmethionine ribosyltransferase-isomerase QueA [Prosthecobacter sp.]|jgi:S-adenosylmethionine:tRNA ribosyltransferase-isomerase|uniref:tRNA preQ1(34) S-adenosylmethionine ribosyltransferase-isomerase QueA n=1 Tax=Prosthecobacter sp. TaxID=1965333 RepID=UPI001A0F32E6|nr:tRNA preQ1(34) S-adenosylmethionine ribosyltransferase-isomerase QueA [Prosthecobacter sp.]MBE2287572.1 tRNA preQ1(34) S-adenosylmethionine ribosyltransferase-isomerase QueA [Prosthecobacter sp.]
MLTSDFDYHLPPELIASEPLTDRAASRMMVVNRSAGVIEHRLFREIGQFVSREAGDMLVLNDTRVVPARYFTDRGHEVLRLEPITPTRWRCMVKPGKKFRIGHTLSIGEATGTVVEILEENGDRIIEFDRVVDESKHGHLALPHYMGRDDQPSDRERYQTVFAKQEGSIAAPTAGLHFTPEVLQTLPHTFVTLHVGVGTFQPVKADKIEDHKMHSEVYSVSESTAAAVQSARRVIPVGTTAMRTLETVARDHGRVVAARGSTDIFIHPGFEFRVSGGLLTNFHLPKSTLIMLVSALAGKELILHAYHEAIRERYRFFSYGDCMLIV